MIWKKCTTRKSMSWRREKTELFYILSSNQDLVSLTVCHETLVCIFCRASLEVLWKRNWMTDSILVMTSFWKIFSREYIYSRWRNIFILFLCFMLLCFLYEFWHRNVRLRNTNSGFVRQSTNICDHYNYRMNNSIELNFRINNEVN